MSTKAADGLANSVDPDQTALSGAVWPRRYKTFSMLNSTEYENFLAQLAFWAYLSLKKG